MNSPSRAANVSDGPGAPPPGRSAAEFAECRFRPIDLAAFALRIPVDEHRLRSALCGIGSRRDVSEPSCHEKTRDRIAE